MVSCVVVKLKMISVMISVPMRNSYECFFGEVALKYLKKVASLDSILTELLKIGGSNFLNACKR
jgi:hypothetical protein